MKPSCDSNEAKEPENELDFPTRATAGDEWSSGTNDQRDERNPTDGRKESAGKDRQPLTGIRRDILLDRQNA